MNQINYCCNKCKRDCNSMNETIVIYQYAEKFTLCERCYNEFEDVRRGFMEYLIKMYVNEDSSSD